MIIYIASYPRSGNSLTQQTIITYFERPITALNPKSRKAKFFANGGAYFVKNWRYNVQPTSGDKTIWQILWDKLNNRIFKIYDLDKWIALYDLNVPPYNKNCRYLLPGCKNVLTPKNRKLLAADRNSHIFIKTHELPFKNYFEGEYVIQPIRHPGAVLWSYFNLSKDFYGDNTISLEKVIRGMVGYGSWSNYHQIWSQAIPSLNGRFIRIRFEDMLLDRLKACEQISATIDLEYNPDNQEPSFEQLHKNNPNHIRAGKATGWEEHYTHVQMELLEKLHGSTMQQLGYEMPNPIKVAQR
jgi:hypothetical protein